MTKAMASKTGKGAAGATTKKGTAAKDSGKNVAENTENKGTTDMTENKNDEKLDLLSADPSTLNKEDKAAREKLIRDTNNAEMKAAKAKLKAFKETDEFKDLPQDVQDAMTRVIGKAAFGGGGGGNLHTGPTFASETAEMFAEVGTAVHELDIFKKFKMGRSEFRKRIRETLKKSEPADRLWIEFNKASESWVLLAKGVKQPEDWAGKDL